VVQDEDDGVVLTLELVHASHSVLVLRLATPAKALLTVARAMKAYLTMMITIWIDCSEGELLNRQTGNKSPECVRE